MWERIFSASVCPTDTSYTEGMLKYTALLYPDPETPGVWIAEFPAVPQAHSFGQSPEEALARAKEALELVLAYLKTEGRPLPRDVQAVEVGVDAA